MGKKNEISLISLHRTINNDGGYHYYIDHDITLDNAKEIPKFNNLQYLLVNKFVDKFKVMLKKEFGIDAEIERDKK